MGTVGTIVQLWGSGYQPDKPVVIRLGRPQPAGEVLVSVVTDAKGKWSAQLSMPDRLPSGDLIPAGKIYLVAMNDQNVPLGSAPFDYAATTVTPPKREGAAEAVRELLSTWNQGGNIRAFLAQNQRQELDAGRPPDRPSEVLFVAATLHYGTFAEERIFTLVVEDGQWRINDGFLDKPTSQQPIGEVVDWQGLRISIPGIYTYSPIMEGPPEINGAPIVAGFRTMQLMGAGPTLPVSLPKPVLFYIVEFRGGPQSWLDNLYTPEIDRAQFKIEPRTVAGLPALKFDPGDPQDADPVEHIVALAPDKPLLIMSDQRYPEHQQIIDGLTCQ